MTTARTRDNTGHPMLDRSSVMATPFSYGAGHIRAARASDPGLVYDLIPTDYLDFLCAIGYNHGMIKEVSEENYSCPKNASLLNFNYPSITVPNLSNHSVMVARSLKNVGSLATYAAHIRQPQGVLVLVEPKTLRFDKIGYEGKVACRKVMYLEKEKWPAERLCTWRATLVRRPSPGKKPYCSRLKE